MKALVDVMTHCSPPRVPWFRATLAFDIQIKWITDIEVTDLESDNHYHYFDNRVLPSQVSSTLGRMCNSPHIWYNVAVPPA